MPTNTNDTPQDSRIDRRQFLQMGVATMGLFLAGRPLANLSPPSQLLGFTPVAASTADSFLVPSGYRAVPLISWGDPLLPGAPAFDALAQSAAAQSGQMGDNNDGMAFFQLAANRAVVAVNNESSNLSTLFGPAQRTKTHQDVLQDQYAHGVSIFEVHRNSSGQWQYDPGGRLNRRITACTPMRISGPATGHALMRTSIDPQGENCLGTLGNCASGMTPWGTYLTCEENVQSYFASRSALELSPAQRRYDLKTEDDNNRGWFRHDPRFDLQREPHEAHRFGWVVEIDPLAPGSVPRKLTALGRFQHENAAVCLSRTGQLVVYMGDDARGEHIYRYVSHGNWSPDAEDNSRLLDEGTLYVARFDSAPGADSGEGEWIELSHGKNGLVAEAGFLDQSHVLIYARLAATVVGATAMDRPEWVAVHPHNGHVMCTLTNNTERGSTPEQPIDGPNPRAGNRFGQIVRWRPAGDDHAAPHFAWDLFVTAGNPMVHQGTPEAGSSNITPENMFNSPDGIGFDDAGRLWIQTDGDSSNQGSFAGMGNNQLLCADPQTGEIRRFATGPRGCEITGMAFTADQRTLFIGVQHPGAKNQESHFPDGGNSVPRSTIMMIQKEDGGIIGT